jgi:hypothetical protein
MDEEREPWKCWEVARILIASPRIAKADGQVLRPRNYDPSGKLDQIKTSVMACELSRRRDNPPEVGIAEEQIKKVKKGKVVLLPITDQTRATAPTPFPPFGSNTWRNCSRRANIEI